MEKKVNINHVKASSIGRLVGTVNAIIALASGIVGSTVAIAAVIADYDYSVLATIGMSAAIIAGGVLLFPLVAFLFGWIYGALIGFIWNVLLSATGGIEVTLEELPATSKK